MTARRKRDELLGLLRPRFGRIETFAQFRKYLAAVMSDLPECNGWSIARFAGDRRLIRRKGSLITLPGTLWR